MICAFSARRAHKLLLLLEGMEVVPLKRPKDLLATLRGPRAAPGTTVVMIDTFGWLGALGLLSSVLLRVPLVLRLRGNPFLTQRDRIKGRRGFARWIGYAGTVAMIKLCMKKARLVVYNSRVVAEEMARLTQNKRTAVVYNPYTEPGTAPPGTKRASAAFPQDGFRLLTVTNVNLYSKVRPTLEAMERWVPPKAWEQMNLRWVVCGSGRHDGSIRETIRGLGLEERVLAPGRVEDVASAYEWCDVLVYLTRLDAFPNVPMEAMARGKPVITNPDSHGTRELVFDGENGFVVGRADSFVSALRRYAEDPALRSRHGEAGRELVEGRFSVSAQRREMEAALEQLFGA